MSTPEIPRKQQRTLFNLFSFLSFLDSASHSTRRPLIDVSKSRYETVLIWCIGTVVAGGIIIINTAWHHRDLAATIIYLTLLLMAANVFSIRVVIGVSLICMGMVVLMFFADEGYKDWESLTGFVRCLTALSAIAFLALRCKRSADTLRQNEVYLAGAMKLCRTGSVGFNANAEHMSWSEESAQTFEYPANMPVTKSMIYARTPVEEHPMLEAFFRKAEQREPQIEIRHRLITPSGQIKHIHMIAIPVFAQDDRFEYLGALTDVTEQVVAEEILYRTQAQLTHICRVTTLGELTASIAHEVNQPLTAINSSADGCRRWLARGEPDIQEALNALQRINDSARRASEVVSRIRALARKSDPVRRPESLNEILKETLSVVHYELSHHHIIPRITLEPASVKVLVDRIQLQQVIINLIINACQAMAAVEKHQRVLQVITRQCRDDVILEVADSGSGIDPQLIPSLFNPFFTTRDNGLGMGLPICRSIIEFHGGRIWVQSDEAGARFLFALPLLAE